VENISNPTGVFTQITELIQILYMILHIQERLVFVLSMQISQPVTD
jgi:hypothetical protein